MRIEFDLPLEFDRVRCEICGVRDDAWYVMHFLADGLWRRLKRGKTLREQGIDEADSSRLYCIHACTETVLSDLVSVGEIEAFLNKLRQGHA